MNARERFLATMNFEQIDRPPLWEFGYWAGAVRRWYGEGLAKKAGVPDWLLDGQSVRGDGAYWDTTRPRERDIHEFMGFDEGIRRVPLNIYISPQFEPRLLEDHGDWFLWRDEDGIVKKDLKSRESLPHFVHGPVQSREDWEQLKAERLRPTLDGRLPENWPELVKEINARDYPLLIGGQQGFYGTPRYLIGEERVLTTFYDDPESAARHQQPHVRHVDKHLLPGDEGRQARRGSDLGGHVLQERPADLTGALPRVPASLL